MDIKEVLRKHTLWLEQSFSGEKADLRRMDCSGLNLSWVDLSCARMFSTNLKYTNLNGATLINADLTGADLTGANLNDAILIGANLNGANLTDANLAGANLTDANLNGANLSGCVGLIEPIDYIEKHFEKSPHGYIVYKVFNESYIAPEYWEIKQGSIITETVNFNRSCGCGCGINVAPLDWIKQCCSNKKIWRCLIEWPWLAGVCVPYNTDGRIRASKIRLLEII